MNSTNRLARCLALWMTIIALGCPAPGTRTVTVPPNDPTPPTALWLQANIPDEPLANVTLGSPDATAKAGHSDVIRVTATATDNDGGVKVLRLYMGEKRTSNGVSTGPGLLGTPAAQSRSTATVGQPAETSRSVSLDIAVDTLMKNTNQLVLELHAEATNFSNGTVNTGILRVSIDVLNLRLHIVAARNDDGAFPFDANPQDFSKLIARTNRVFSKSGLRLVFNPASDWETFNRTVLNRQQTGWWAIADSIAGKHPGRIPGILRWGPDASRTGNANAYPPPGASAKHPGVNDVAQRFVMLENFLREGDFSFLNLHGGSHLAHELGHYLGLYHTFPDWTDKLGIVYAPLFGPGMLAPTKAQIDQRVIDFITANGGSTWALDGDQITDTPPDPSPTLFSIHGQKECESNVISVAGTVAGSSVTHTFTPDNRNAMSYFGNCNVDAAGVPIPQRFSAGQMARMRAVVASDPWLKQLIAGQP
jgi:hypothetical protein